MQRTRIPGLGRKAGKLWIASNGVEKTYPSNALTEGVWLRPLGNVIVIMPPLAITLPELDRICLAAERGIVQVGQSET